MLDKKTKGLVVAVVGAGLLVLFIFSLFKSVKVEQNLRIQKEKALASKVIELTQKEAELAGAVRERAAFEKKVQEHDAQLKSITEGYEGRLKALTENSEALARDNEVLSKERDAGLRQIEDLNARIASLEADRAGLEGRIEELLAAQAFAAEPPRAAAKNSAPVVPPAADVQLGKIMIQRASGRAAQVQHVDGVYGFVIINAGVRDGMRRGTLLNILREGRVVAKAVVEKVQDNVSAAVLLPEWTQDEIRAGDTVSRL